MFLGEKRALAIDFWLRYPDYLADQLLNLYEAGGGQDLFDAAKRILVEEEPDVRLVKMIRWQRGAFDDLQTSLAILGFRGLTKPMRRKQANGHIYEYERLRMRVAASLATMKVARDRGFGRHPGLLVLDSPAAGEMSTPDFTRLIGAVNDIVADIPGVQVIVGGIKRPELDGVVDFAHRREAVGVYTLF